jgi:hypothetical protein
MKSLVTGSMSLARKTAGHVRNEGFVTNRKL